MFFKHSFHFIPKNTFTHFIHSKHAPKLFPPNILNIKLFDQLQFRYQNNIYIPDLNNCNIDYNHIHYSNNRIFTQLHIQNSDFEISEYFYVKPHSIYNNLAKVDCALVLNQEKMYQFNFDSEYNVPKKNYNYTLFDQKHISNILSRKYLGNNF
jgi:hypothetical protein